MYHTQRPKRKKKNVFFKKNKAVNNTRHIQDVMHKIEEWHRVKALQVHKKCLHSEILKAQCVASATMGCLDLKRAGNII